ncbi:caspase, EACC1-associated type [Actinoplanes sp. URMC 104]|uniref:caspase, EACC1-associated type n=1 Tax=Actinoplanes sp. URMC 104 TaxID=3423409 RepID=UPI003F1CAB86
MGRHALLLGTATYHSDPLLHPLPGVHADVRELKAVLDSDGDFDTAEAHLDLSSAGMRRVVEEFFGARRTGDLAFFYYSGHGVLRDDDRQSLFLAANDTDTSAPHATAFDVDGILRDMLGRTKAAQRVVIFDCCFSGAFSARHRFSGGMRQEPRYFRRERGTFILQSSDHQKASKARGPDEPSVFTAVLLDGLRGAAQATADDGWITTSDLARYAMAEMARRRENRPVESSEGVTEPIRLVAGASDRVTRTVRTPPEPDDAPFDAERWRRLLVYYADCLQRSAVLQFFIDPAQKDSYLAAPSGRELIFLGTQPTPLKERGRKLAAFAEAEGRSLQYGYPVVALRPDGRSQIRLAPLLVCDLTVGDDGTLHSEPPHPSPVLVDHFQLSPVEADELRQAVAERLVPGDRGTLAEVTSLVATTFGLKPVTALDPGDLDSTVRTAPLNRVQNAALLFAAGGAESPERQLIEDLREIARMPGQIATTALGALAGGSGHQEPAQVLTVAAGPVNEAQEAIIRSAMSTALTVAQGPPGTGKSQLVTALLATATAAGQSVLIGSTNNQAVDEVVKRVDDMVGPGLLLRTGNKKYRQQEPQYLTDVIRKWPPPAPGEPAPDERPPREELRIVAQEIDRLRDELQQRRRIERDLADLAVERDPDAFDLPTDDIALKKLVVRTDRALHSRWLGWWYRHRLRALGVVDSEAIATLGERAEIESRWRERQLRLGSLSEPEAVVWERLQRLQRTDRPQHSRDLLRAQVAARVARHADLLRDRADEMAKPEGKSWRHLPQLLSVLPGWAVTAMSARRLRPLPAMFDLVVIDEAAQCTVPAILPMLFRAKRALVIGDPRQLTPVVELSDEDDRAQQARAGVGNAWLEARRLTYSGYSAYEAFAAAAGSTSLLDEHYRCHPEIIDAPNQAIYQGRLTVLTDPRRLAATAERASRWVHVGGRYNRGSTGSGWNAAEVEAVAGEVRQLRESWPAASIGVVTPLAAQQRRLEQALRRSGLAGDVMCETIHKFQGSEKDIMVVSPVGAQGISDRTRGWLVNQTNLWNVAITRARSQLIVVGDRSWWSGQRGLLASLAVATPPATGAELGTRPSDRLVGGLRKAGLSVGWDTPLRGYPVDLTVRDGAKQLAVLIDDPAGDPDGRALRRILARLEILATTTEVRRIPAWRCFAEPDRVVAELRAALT